MRKEYGIVNNKEKY